MCHCSKSYSLGPLCLGFTVVAFDRILLLVSFVLTHVPLARLFCALPRSRGSSPACPGFSWSSPLFHCLVGRVGRNGLLRLRYCIGGLPIPCGWTLLAGCMRCVCSLVSTRVFDSGTRDGLLSLLYYSCLFWVWGSLAVVKVLLAVGICFARRYKLFPRTHSMLLSCWRSERDVWLEFPIPNILSSIFG